LNARGARFVEEFGPGCGLVSIDLQDGATNEDELAEGIVHARMSLGESAGTPLAQDIDKDHFLERRERPSLLAIAARDR
jgi:hypothetical protein